MISIANKKYLLIKPNAGHGVLNNASVYYKAKICKRREK